MNLLQLKRCVEAAIERAEGFESAENIAVSIQIVDPENPHHGFFVCSDPELTYDCNGMASGCVIHGWRDEDEEA